MSIKLTRVWILSDRYRGKRRDIRICRTKADAERELSWFADQEPPQVFEQSAYKIQAKTFTCSGCPLLSIFLRRAKGENR